MQREVDKSLNVVDEFSRFAHKYKEYNSVQSQVASYLSSRIEKKHYTQILDLGCGDGELYKSLDEAISFEKFIALDYAKEMLLLHPTHPKIEKVYGDFSTINALDIDYTQSLILSSSALQWSKDIEQILSSISHKSQNIYLSIFTSNTFKTLHQTASLSSPIYDKDSLKEMISKTIKNVSFETKTYTLTFDSTKEMLRYIKRSGVSGGEKRLSIKEIKQLIDNYPLNYLEFEILFAIKV